MWLAISTSFTFRNSLLDIIQAKWQLVVVIVVVVVVGVAVVVVVEDLELAEERMVPVVEY